MRTRFVRFTVVTATRLAGSVLIGLGLGTDIVAGAVVMNGDVVTGLAAHIPAVMVWAAGARLMGRDPIATGTIALVTFPGVGTAGLTVAGILWPFLTLHNRASRTIQPALPVESDRPAVQDVPAINPLREVEVQPLVDALRDGNPILKRGAVDFLGRQPRPDAVRLVRRLLTDTDLEVRNEAAVTLYRLENDTARAIAVATAAVERNPRDPNGHAHLGQLCREYASSGLADRVSGRFYVLQARMALRRALELDPDGPRAADYWLELARAHRDLGQLRAARTALDEAIARGSGALNSAETTSVAMEIALAEHSWDLMRDLGWPAAVEADGGESDPGSAGENGSRMKEREFVPAR